MQPFSRISRGLDNYTKKTMQVIWIAALLSGCAVCLAAETQYTDRYDSINIDEILANRRLLLPYVKCLLDQGRCTAEGKELKLHVKDGMQSACSKCTEWQKKSVRKVVKHLREKEPEYWQQVIKKNDPENKFAPVYEPFLAGTD